MAPKSVNSLPQASHLGLMAIRFGNAKAGRVGNRKYIPAGRLSQLAERPEPLVTKCQPRMSYGGLTQTQKAQLGTSPMA